MRRKVRTVAASQCRGKIGAFAAETAACFRICNEAAPNLAPEVRSNISVTACNHIAIVRVIDDK